MAVSKLSFLKFLSVLCLTHGNPLASVGCNDTQGKPVVMKDQLGEIIFPLGRAENSLPGMDCMWVFPEDGQYKWYMVQFKSISTFATDLPKRRADHLTMTSFETNRYEGKGSTIIEPYVTQHTALTIWFHRESDQVGLSSFHLRLIVSPISGTSAEPARMRELAGILKSDQYPYYFNLNNLEVENHQLIFIIRPAMSPVEITVNIVDWYVVRCDVPSQVIAFDMAAPGPIYFLNETVCRNVLLKQKKMVGINQILLHLTANAVVRFKATYYTNISTLLCGQKEDMIPFLNFGLCYSSMPRSCKSPEKAESIKRDANAKDVSVKDLVALLLNTNEDMKTFCVRDVNECSVSEEWRTKLKLKECSHQCINTYASYYCGCNDGFYLNAIDYKSCINFCGNLTTATVRYQTRADGCLAVSQQSVTYSDALKVCPPNDTTMQPLDYATEEHYWVSSSNESCFVYDSVSTTILERSCHEQYKAVCFVPVGIYSSSNLTVLKRPAAAPIGLIQSKSFPLPYPVTMKMDKFVVRVQRGFFIKFTILHLKPVPFDDASVAEVPATKFTAAAFKEITLDQTEQTFYADARTRGLTFISEGNELSIVFPVKANVEFGENQLLRLGSLTEDANFQIIYVTSDTGVGHGMSGCNVVLGSNSENIVLSPDPMQPWQFPDPGWSSVSSDLQQIFVNCVWNIKTSPGKTISISQKAATWSRPPAAISFSAEAKLHVFDVRSDEVSRIGVFQIQTFPFIVSVSNSIFLKLKESKLRQKYSMDPADTALLFTTTECPGCGFDLFTTEKIDLATLYSVFSRDTCDNFVAQCQSLCGHIASPLYPQSLVQIPNLRCRWLIETRLATFLQLDFDVYSLGTDRTSNCKSVSRVEIWEPLGANDNWLMAESFCNKNSSSGHTIESHSNTVRVELVTDSNNSTVGGFRMKYATRQVWSQDSSLTGGNECPPDWRQFERSCYKAILFPNKTTWTEAAKQCEAMGAHLVSILTTSEMQFVFEYLLQLLHSNAGRTPMRFYMGLTKKKGKWRWVDEHSLFYTSWFPGMFGIPLQPSSVMFELCSMIWLRSFRSSGNWHDIVCSQAISPAALCEKAQSPRDQVVQSFTSDMDVSHLIDSKQLHQCVSGDLIRRQRICDQNEDCIDKSDESKKECDGHSTKTTDHFRCTNQRVIHVSFLCDHRDDCGDRSDEMCEHPPCPPNSRKCVSTSQCVQESQWCDLIADCYDQSDESDCITHSVNDDAIFRCFDGTLIPRSARCDAFIDCPGFAYEDEPGLSADVGISEECSHLRFGCPNDTVTCKSGACASPVARCLYDEHENGHPLGCRDMSHLSPCASFSCPAGYFHCPDAFCISWRKLCNGERDCPDGADELPSCVPAPGVPGHHCANHYHCWQSKFTCIPLDQLCNGHRECPLGDDEFLCGFTCAEGCSCDGLSVVCSQLGLDSLPSGLSSQTRTLDLSSNHLQLVNVQWDLLPYVLYLDLSDNALTTIPPSSLAPLINLRELRLSKNNLVSLEGALLNLTRLQFLVLTRCCILDSLAPFTFVDNHELTQLDLSGLGIRTLHKDSFQGLRVRRLLLYDNPISAFSSESFTSIQDSLQFLHSDEYALCCLVADVECLPARDALSSCEDLMSSDFLRAMLWLQGVMALLGNTFVVLWRINNPEVGSRSNGKFVFSLAVSDLLMGVYLLIIASVDMHYRGRYITVAKEWRHSILCKAAGVISAVSSEVSIMTLALISLDRFICIVFPFSPRKITPRQADCLIVCTWILVASLAVAPLVLFDNYFHGEFYARSGVCLALHITNNRPPGWEYAVALFLVVNIVALSFVMICYIIMYRIIKKTMEASGSKGLGKDLIVARKLALVVSVDLLCWTPICASGIIALVSSVEIPGAWYSWVAVVFLPINAALNPILYTYQAMVHKQVEKTKKPTVLYTPRTQKPAASSNQHTAKTCD